jgi:hypothetical protein
LAALEAVVRPTPRYRVRIHEQAATHVADGVPGTMRVRALPPDHPFAPKETPRPRQAYRKLQQTPEEADAAMLLNNIHVVRSGEHRAVKHAAGVTKDARKRALTRRAADPTATPRQRADAVMRLELEQPTLLTGTDYVAVEHNPLAEIYGALGEDEYAFGFGGGYGFDNDDDYDGALSVPRLPRARTLPQPARSALRPPPLPTEYRFLHSRLPIQPAGDDERRAKRILDAMHELGMRVDGDTEADQLSSVFETIIQPRMGGVPRRSQKARNRARDGAHQPHARKGLRRGRS